MLHVQFPTRVQPTPSRVSFPSSNNQWHLTASTIAAVTVPVARAPAGTGLLPLAAVTLPRRTQVMEAAVTDFFYVYFP